VARAWRALNFTAGSPSYNHLQRALPNPNPTNDLTQVGLRMVEVEGPADAEDRAREFIRERHPKVRRILFERVDRKGDAWLIDGEVWFKRLRLFTIKRTFRLRIGSETGEVTSYQETRSGARMLLLLIAVNGKSYTRDTPLFRTLHYLLQRGIACMPSAGLHEEGLPQISLQFFCISAHSYSA